jgi:hypothetical protein
MKDKTFKNINLLFVYVSLFIIVKYGVTTIHDIYYTFKYQQINNFLNEYVRVLQNIIFFGSLLSLLLSRFKAFSFSIPLAFLEVDYSFFNMQVAPLLIKNNSNISPEYIRIIFFLIILGIFLFRSIWKKRKITDIFLTLSMSGVLGTAILFHIITTKQLDYFTEKQELKWQQVMKYKNIDYLCVSENLICEKITDNQNIKIDFVKDYYNEFKFTMNNYPEYFNYFISTNHNTLNRILGRKPLAFVKYEGTSYYILDDISYTEYLKFNERMFGYLAISSHIVWIFGALYLIHFHSKRKKKLIDNNFKSKKIEIN